MKRSVILFSGLTLILLVFISCSLKIPGSPVWMVEVTVPFSQRTYRLAELITDPGKLGEDKYGLLYGRDGVILEFVWEDSIEYDQIGDDRMTYGASDVGNYVNSIDTIKIEASHTDTSVLFITDFLPDSLIGKTGIVREFDIPQTENQFHYSTFRWIDVKSGWAVFRIENYFPCPVDSITLTLYNSQDDTLVPNPFIGSLFIPGPINSGSYIIDSLVISNKTVLSDIRIIFEGHATGTYRTKTITGEEEILIICGIAETTVEAVNAEIQVQHFTVLDTLDYDDPNRIVDAVVSQGWVRMELQNNLPLRLMTETCFTNIFTPDNEVLVKSLILEPGSVENPSISLDSTNLTDHRMMMSLDKQAVFARSEVMSEDTRITRYQDSTFQTVTSYQGVIGDYWLSKLYFKEFTGVIDSASIEVTKQDKKTTELPDEIEDINFVEDTLFICMNNGTAMPLWIQMDVEANSSANDTSVMIHVNDIILPGLDTIRVPDADRLITILPDTISYYGIILLGARYSPEYRDSIITMTASDSIGGNVSLRSEMKFTSSAKTVTSEPEKLEKSLNYPVESAKLNITLVNSIPLSGNIKLMMGTDTTDMTTLVDIDIPHGTIENHRVKAVHKTFVIDLGEAEFDIIKQDNVYTQQRMVFYGTESDTVWLYGADSLDVQATATIIYIVDPGDNYER